MAESVDHIGPHERHYRRKSHNPLFRDSTPVTESPLAAARNKDHAMLVAYHQEFETVLQHTVSLKSNEESDVILGLKERLDRLYEMAAAISDNPGQHQTAIAQLLDVIMAAVRNGAGDDLQALKELEQETLARQAHFQLLQSPLVADLLNPESPIQQNELVATLLSSATDDLSLALQIFDEPQLMLILHEAEQLMETTSGSHPLIQQAKQNLMSIRNYISSSFDSASNS